METGYNIRTTDMPTEMQSLLREYPRTQWDGHPGFQEKTRQWLRAHQSFRQLAQLMRIDAEAYLDTSMAPDIYARRLSRFGNALVSSLHGHHGWEDHSYFPELSAADPRFDKGLDLLEQDHADLDVVLEDVTLSANRALKLMHLEEAQAPAEVGKVHTAACAIESFLERHLGDEEELAVPIILHHRLRG